jgi:sugar phosphate permease
VANTSRQVGGALGVAVLGAVAGARFTAVLPGRQAGEAVASAFVTGIHAAYLLAGLALAAGAVVAVALLRPRPGAVGRPGAAAAAEAAGHEGAAGLPP